MRNSQVANLHRFHATVSFVKPAANSYSHSFSGAFLYQLQFIIFILQKIYKALEFLSWGKVPPPRGGRGGGSPLGDSGLGRVTKRGLKAEILICK